MDPGAELILRLVFMGVFGTITAVIASNKGRNAAGWFFVGFLTGCIGLIIVLCLPDLRREQARWDQGELERRRLREQLKQERMKSEAFQGHVRTRLDVHDEALGMDTRRVTGESQSPEPQQLAFPESSDTAGQGDFASREWYVAIEGRRSDPLSLQQLRELVASRRIDATHLVWSAGMEGWKRIDEIPGLEEALA
jgi:hypothetical protein